jgi:hypothetical protein
VKPVAVAFIALLFPLLPLAAQAHSEGVPKLAVENSCRDAKLYGMTDPEQTYKNCMLDENEAKQQLEAKWSDYKAATRRQCLAAGANPSPSYVELLTCIEMTDEILNPATGGGGGGGGGGAPPGSLGSPPPRPALSPGPRAMPR